MKLSLAERFAIQKSLPKEGSFTTLKILNSLRMSLAPSEEEIKEYNIREEDGRIYWTELEEKEIEIGEKATDLIVEALKTLDKSNKLTNEHFTIYEKFVK